MDWDNPMAVFGFDDEPQAEDGEVYDERDDDFYADQKPKDDVQPGVCFWLAFACGHTDCRLTRPGRPTYEPRWTGHSANYCYYLSNTLSS